MPYESDLEKVRKLERKCELLIEEYRTNKEIVNRIKPIVSALKMIERDLERHWADRMYTDNCSD